ncbi:hypothetical protein [Streptomyces sp. NPDC029003]|uniref:hypothetical protein n=1 Tax=Streptomyces sp. NPDC029003 TaxID=3155125 RepID=UPI0033CDD3D5
MRFAHRAEVVLAAFAVAAFALSAPPQAADAAQGGFTFRYTAGGHTRAGLLRSPADGVCLDAAGSMGGSGRADTAKNRTRTTATLYMSIDCEDDGIVLAPGATHLSPFKTVRFG